MPGWIAYHGPSTIAPAVDVVVIVTPHTTNTKTGPMAQAWVLLADQHPVEGTSTGADRHICGTCVHRGDPTRGRTRTCYVNVAWAPAQVYTAYQRGHYDRAWPEAVGPIRLGAYGDPAVVPYRIWAEILARQTTPAWTGYTHLWRDRRCDPRFKRILMASVDSPREAAEAQAEGWRTFRVRTTDQPLRAGEIICPASDEADHRVQCVQCRLCMGQAKPAKAIAIYVHGTATRTGMQRLQQPILPLEARR